MLINSHSPCLDSNREGEGRRREGKVMEGKGRKEMLSTLTFFG